MADFPKTQMVTLIACKMCHHSFLAGMRLIEEVHQMVCIHCGRVMATNDSMLYLLLPRF